ncbi:TPA: hypothetical protein ACH3X1_003309 [Trebouxia sp. C0004]
MLLLLFRILGSTAENFFSPILTQLSQELGLPPRLAGVTFLALGNGAPDISSSIAAVRAGQYKMALGSLLELFLEQETLMGGQPPSPPRAALDMPIPLQRYQTEHESTLTAATRQGTKQSWLFKSAESAQASCA